MGHFSYSCQLSGLPITSGTKCAIVPMLPRENFYDNGEEHFRKFGKSMFCSNEGVNIFFNELSFPIFGEYDEYGGIENIIKDDNSKCLEEYFELSIEDICSVLCDGRKNEYFEGSDFSDSVKILKKKNIKHHMLLKASLVWLHADFYNNLSNKKSSDCSDKLDMGGSGILDKLGFKLVGEVKKERYNQEYEKDGLKIWSDGNWLNVPDKPYLYYLTDLKEYCESKGVSLDISELQNAGYHEQVYECVLPYINNLKERDRWKTDRAIHLLLGDEHKIRMGNQPTEDMSIKLYEHSLLLLEKGEEEVFKTDMSIEELKAIIKLLKKSSKKQLPLPKQYLAEFYFDKIKKEGNSFLKSNIINWHNVKSYYYTLGKYLYPIGISPQDGDYKSTKIFFDTVSTTLNTIMEERVKKGWESDEDEIEKA